MPGENTKLLLALSASAERREQFVNIVKAASADAIKELEKRYLKDDLKRDKEFGGGYAPSAEVLAQRERSRQRMEVEALGKKLWGDQFASEMDGDKGVWVTYKDNRDKAIWNAQMKMLGGLLKDLGLKLKDHTAIFDDRRVEAAKKAHPAYIKLLAKKGSKGAQKLLEGSKVMASVSISAGYSHYWSLSRNTDDFITDEEWSKITSGTKKIFKEAKKKGIKLAGPMGTGKPVVDNEHIAFNGVGDDGHESFYFKRVFSGQDFCKTQMKPYDNVVVSVLALAKKVAPKKVYLDTDNSSGKSLFKKPPITASVSAARDTGSSQKDKGRKAMLAECINKASKLAETIDLNGFPEVKKACDAVADLAEMESALAETSIKLKAAKSKTEEAAQMQSKLDALRENIDSMITPLKATMDSMESLVLAAAALEGDFKSLTEQLSGMEEKLTADKGRLASIAQAVESTAQIK